MTPEKCPGCGAKLRPDMLACPNCPMSFPEDDGPTHAVNPLKQSRYYQFVFPVLFFGAIGMTVWYLAVGLMRLGQANSQFDSGGSILGTNAPIVKKSDGAAHRAEANLPEDEGIVVITRAGPEPVPFARDEREEQPKAARPAHHREAARAAPPPPPPAPTKAPTEWRLRGTVYDLTTLKPLAGCTIVFSDGETNRKTTTDPAGRYRTTVPPLSDGKGYSVTIEKNSYSSNYLDPGTENVRGMGATERKGIARDLSTMLAAAPSTVASASDEPLITDFYLAPRP